VSLNPGRGLPHEGNIMFSVFKIPSLTPLALALACAGSPALAQVEFPAAAIWDTSKADARTKAGPKATAKTDPKTTQSSRPPITPAAPRPAEPAAPKAAAPKPPAYEEIERANKNTVSIVSGPPAGTYMTAAYDISAVLDKGEELRILPIIGQGGVQNVRDVLYLRNVDLGITQSNIVSFFKGKGESALVYIAKLFNEEIHILARRDIASLKDLEGKRVNFSETASGTQFTAQQIFKAAGVNPVEANMNQIDALEAMRRGEIDATLFVTGKPSTFFQDLRKDDNFHLLPVGYDGSLEEEYFPAEITHEDYPNLVAEGAPVETVAVGAVLVGYNWPKYSERYNRLAAFTTTFFDTFEEFRKPPRHVKWGETNLAAEVATLKRFEPAQEWLKAHAEPEITAPSNEEKKLRQQFDAFLSASGKSVPDTATRDQLFREFLTWQGRK
jgi:TRAP transporter TAXI family solute receptor